MLVFGLDFSKGIFKTKATEVFNTDYLMGNLHVGYLRKVNGINQFIKPVVLLTDHFSVSTAEDFGLHMTAMAHVTHIGDTTAGAFSTTSNHSNKK